MLFENIPSPASNGAKHYLSPQQGKVTAKSWRTGLVLILRKAIPSHSGDFFLQSRSSIRFLTSALSVCCKPWPLSPTHNPTGTLHISAHSASPMLNQNCTKSPWCYSTTLGYTCSIFYSIFLFHFCLVAVFFFSPGESRVSRNVHALYLFKYRCPVMPISCPLFSCLSIGMRVLTRSAIQ